MGIINWYVKMIERGGDAVMDAVFAPPKWRLQTCPQGGHHEWRREGVWEKWGCWEVVYRCQKCGTICEEQSYFTISKLMRAGIPPIEWHAVDGKPPPTIADWERLVYEGNAKRTGQEIMPDKREPEILVRPLPDEVPKQVEYHFDHGESPDVFG